MKAIIPAAGLGTRLLPITKVVPKELMPIGGKPAIQWVLEEAVDAGLRELIVVISPHKAILRSYLKPLGADHPLIGHPGLTDLKCLLSSVDIAFVEQPKPLGLGDAILRCRDLVGENSFALLLPDNICPLESRLMARLLEAYDTYGKSCIALQETRGAASSGGVFVAEPWRPPLYNIQRVLPKGMPEEPGTDRGGIGRCILEPTAFTYLEQARGEGVLDDVPALNGLAQDGRLLGLLTTDRVNHLGVTMSERTDVHVREAWKDTWKFAVAGHASQWSLHQALRQEVKERWNRAVPFADELFDRWERAAFLGFGQGASLYDASLVLGDVRVGEKTWIGPFAVLDGRGGLVIGQYCSISAGVHLYSHDTVKWALTGGKAPEARRPTRVGDCCYIGPMAIVSAGVTVGEHSVIGANSFVREDIPPFSVAAGTPARLIGRVELVDGSDVRFIYEKKA